jgi:cytoskeletal protein CcmA (bactofilin family)
MRHLTLTLAKDGQAANAPKPQDARQVTNPKPIENEKSGPEAATAAPAPAKEVVTREVQRTIAPGTGPQNCLPESILVRGEITGQSDLTVEGRVDGPINLGTNDLTIGRTGQVNGNVQARNIVILGRVVGDVVATERVEITDSGCLVGAIRAPRIAFLDGAHFKGSVDMASLVQSNVMRREPASPTPAPQEHTVLQVGVASK